MSNLSRSRSAARRAAKSIRYGYQTRTAKKAVKPFIYSSRDFLKYSLVNCDIMIALNIEDIIPEYVLSESNLVTNNVFDNIRCDKVALIYSPKKKLFMYLALNDDYTCFILFKSKDLFDLPHIDKIDLDLLPVDAQIIENINRLLNTVYELVHDLTYNPILIYKINEIFKK